MKRICIFCKHFYLYEGSPGYSEMTPGSDMSMGCEKGYWTFDPNGDTRESYREKILKAETCSDFEEAK